MDEKNINLHILEELKSKWQICDGCATLCFYVQVYLSVPLQYKRIQTN